MRITAAEYQKLFVKPKKDESENKKIKGARKIVRDGVKFDSMLEMHMYDLLNLFKISFVFQKKYILQEKFRHNNKAVRRITYTVDFYLPAYNCLIDTKGHRTQQGTLRIKMLKRWLHENGETTEIYLPKNDAECQSLINKLRQK